MDEDEFEKGMKVKLKRDVLGIPAGSIATVVVVHRARYYGPVEHLTLKWHNSRHERIDQANGNYQRNRTGIGNDFSKTYWHKSKVIPFYHPVKPDESSYSIE